MVGFVEKTGREHGVQDPIQMTVATTDGRTIWAFRYSSEGASRSLYFSTRMDALKALHPESTELAGLSDETRAVVSEPLGDLAGAWNEVPEAHVGIIQPGRRRAAALRSIPIRRAKPHLTACRRFASSASEGINRLSEARRPGTSAQQF